MSITAASLPPDYSPAKNPNVLKYRLTTDNRWSTIPVTWGGYIRMDTKPANDETLIIDIDGTDYSFTFTFKDTPTDCYHVDRSGTLEQTLTALYNAMLKVYHLITNYDIEQTDLDQIDVWSKVAGTDKAFLYSGTGNGNFTQIGYDIGAEGIERDGFRMLSDVWLEEVYQSDTYTRIVHQRLPPNDQDEVEFDVYEMILPYFTYPVPAFGSTSSALRTEIIKRVLIRHAEYYDGLEQCYNSSDVRTFIYAGLSERKLFQNNFIAEHFTNSGGTRKFLTSMPRSGVCVTPSQHHYLYMWGEESAPDTVQIYQLGVTLYYTDGSNSNHLNIMSKAAENQVIMWPAGYDDLDIDSIKDIGKTVLNYEVFVQKQGPTDLTESILFILDNEHYEYTEYFLLQNSKGGMDTLWCSGIKTEIAAVVGQRYESEQELQSSEDLVRGSSSEALRIYTDAFLINTGYKSKAFLTYLREALKTEYCLYMHPDGYYVECRIEVQDEVELRKDDQDEYALQLKVQFTQRERGYIE